jgi:hypothetical protein
VRTIGHDVESKVVVRFHSILDYNDRFLDLARNDKEVTAQNDKLSCDLLRGPYAEFSAVAAASGSVTIKPSYVSATI